MTSTLSWQDIFTIPDSNIVKVSTEDPLGLQAIWVPFGQAIFNNRITTISNDLRNYTLNLVNHYCIYKLSHEYADQFKNAKKKFNGYKNDYDVKAGMLIFLENLYAFVMFLEETDINIDKRGVLGISNAEKKYNEEGFNIEIVANSNDGVLINQINLGVNGRYKGPFVKIGFFNRQFNFNPTLWEEVDSIIQNNKNLKLLTDILIQHLLNLCQQEKSDYPRVVLKKIHRDGKTRDAILT